MLNISKSLLANTGEALSVEYLQHKGLILLARNFHSSFGEIDIIFRDHEEVVFVEVKTRTNHNIKYAENSITLSKRKKITKTAQVYLDEYSEFSAFSCRFDLMLVFHYQGDDTYKLLHYKNAFEPVYS